MIRKTLVTLALTAGMVSGTAGAASAHECFVAKRSAQGTAGATSSDQWSALELRGLFQTAHDFLGGPPLTEPQVEEALALAEAAGVPLTVAVFEPTTIPRGGKSADKSSDGKGIDHFFAAYGDTIMPIFFTVQSGSE